MRTSHEVVLSRWVWGIEFSQFNSDNAITWLDTKRNEGKGRCSYLNTEGRHRRSSFIQTMVLYITSYLDTQKIEFDG